VATTIGGRRSRALPVAVGAAALIFIGAMAVTGGRRENQQLVKFRAAGIMKASPGDVDHVDVEREGRRVTFARVAGGWIRDGTRGPVSAPEVEHLEMSLRFMHVAEPVRVMETGEWQGTPEGEFGLAPPRYAIRLSGQGRVILAARFGATNPQQVLQYTRVEGRDQLYLMPRFVGIEWERVWDDSVAR
jgi:hypothetical protein